MVENKAQSQTKIIPPHGGYKTLESYKNAEIAHDCMVVFCRRWIKSYKLKEQMEGATRSGKQNIAEGSVISGTSKKSELKLLGVARGSFEEALADLYDFLRQRGLELWGKEDPRVRPIRRLVYEKYKSYGTYRTYIESENPEVAANALITLISQTTFLLDRQLARLEQDFLKDGGFTERLYQARVEYRKKP